MMEHSSLYDTRYDLIRNYYWNGEIKGRCSSIELCWDLSAIPCWRKGSVGEHVTCKNSCRSTVTKVVSNYKLTSEHVTDVWKLLCGIGCHRSRLCRIIDCSIVLSNTRHIKKEGMTHVYLTYIFVPSDTRKHYVQSFVFTGVKVGKKKSKEGPWCEFHENFFRRLKKTLSTFDCRRPRESATQTSMKKERK
jgi:hypothetical protein